MQRAGSETRRAAWTACGGVFDRLLIPLVEDGFCRWDLNRGVGGSGGIATEPSTAFNVMDRLCFLRPVVFRSTVCLGCASVSNSKILELRLLCLLM